MNNIRLSEYFDEITKGTTPTTIGARFVNQGVNFVKAECLNTGRIIDKKSLSYISPETHKKLNRSILKDGDLLFSIAGHLGKMAIVRKNDLPANTNQAVAILRINQKKANVDFLYYYLCSKQVSEYIGSQCAQSVQPNLNLAQVGELPIIEYPLSYQQKIASVLSTLDTKIEFNNRINAELKAMAKTLYDYWFVQFDFPDKNGKPYKTSGGKMHWNERLKRDIPDGWEVQKIDTVTYKINSGGTPSTIRKDFYNGDISWYATNELQDDFLIGSKNLITKIGLNESSAKLFPAETILIAIYAAPTVGRLGILTQEGTFNQACCGILADENIVSKEYLFLTLLSMRKQFNAIAVGTAQKNLSVGQLKNLYTLVPPQKINNLFKLQTQYLFKKQLINQLENQKLTELRDWLLPMLMNGQVKVKEAEERLSMATEPGVKYGEE